MQSREEKKRQTRKSLMDAALNLTGAGDNFASISLREVAKHAGVVPTSFYRHFTGMEELGLNIVDDLGMMLRKLMRATRQDGDYFQNLARSSIEVYADFVCAHKNYFFFMAQCRTGGTLGIRSAIRNELKYFANELTSDIRPLSVLSRINNADLDMISQHIVESVFENTIDLLDQMESTPDYRDVFIDQTLTKLRLIWLGTNAWQSRRP